MAGLVTYGLVWAKRRRSPTSGWRPAFQLREWSGVELRVHANWNFKLKHSPFGYKKKSHLKIACFPGLSLGKPGVLRKRYMYVCMYICTYVRAYKKSLRAAHRLIFNKQHKCIRRVPTVPVRSRFPRRLRAARHLHTKRSSQKVRKKQVGSWRLAVLSHLDRYDFWRGPDPHARRISKNQ